MDSGAGVDHRQVRRNGGLGNLQGAVHLVRTVADADGEDGAHLGRISSLEDLKEFLIGVHVEMGVAVDEVH